MATPNESFEDFLKRRETISGEYISGQSQSLIEISPSSGEATFFPPNGLTVQGAEAVNAANEAGAKSFKTGSTGHFEIFQSGSNDDLGFWTGLQHAQALLQDAPGPVAMRLRVTEIFRRIDGKWKLVHRHADPAKS